MKHLILAIVFLVAFLWCWDKSEKEGNPANLLACILCGVACFIQTLSFGCAMVM